MDKDTALRILDEASAIISAINSFNKKYSGQAEIFSLGRDGFDNMKIHLSEGGADVVSALQLTTRIYPVILENGLHNVFVTFEHNGNQFWFGEVSL